MPQQPPDTKKPPFDPNKHFVPENKEQKPAFDPNKPFIDEKKNGGKPPVTPTAPSKPESAEELGARINKAFPNTKEPSPQTPANKVFGVRKQPVTNKLKVKEDNTINFEPSLSTDIKTPDGGSLSIPKKNLDVQSPEYIKGLQERVDANKVTPFDINSIADATGKPYQVVQAYLTKGKRIGFAVENLDTEARTKKDVVDAVNSFNKDFGASFKPEEVLGSSQKASQFISEYEDKQAKKVEEMSMYLGKQKGISEDEIEGMLNEVRNKYALSKQLLDSHIVNQTILEDQKNGVPKDQTILNIAYKTNPRQYSQLVEAKAKSAMPNMLNPVKALGDAYDALFGTKDKDDLLNTEKGHAEIMYNDGVQTQAINKMSQGILSNNQSLIQQGKAQLDSVDQDAIYKYPSLVKQEIARRVNETIAAESGQLQGSETYDYRLKFEGAEVFDYAAAMKKLGYLDDPKTKDIAASMLQHPELFADASYFGGIGNSFMQPFKELGMSVADIAQFRNPVDLLSDKKRDELFPKELENTKTLIGNVTTRSIFNTTANLAGMAAISAVTEGVGTNLGLSATASKSLAAYTSFGLPSFDGALKDSYNFLDNDAARTLYATISAVTNAEGGKLLDLGKVVRIPGVSEAYAKMAKGLTENTITKKGVQELLSGTKNKYIDFAIKYGKNVTKGAATMAYFNISNNIEKLVFGDPAIKGDEILPQAAHAFIDGVTGMSIMGAFGAVSDMRNEKNTSYKGFIYNMALNHDSVEDVFKQGLKDGTYTQAEFNQKMQILNTARVAKRALDAAQSENNVNLSENQKAVYVANKTASNILRKKLEELPQEKENQKGELKSQISKLDEQNRNILEGLKFTPTLEPLYDLFEAEKEYNEAVNEANDGNGDLSKIEKAKQKIDNAILEHEKAKNPEGKNTEDKNTKGKVSTNPEGKEEVLKDRNITDDLYRAAPQLSEDDIGVLQPVIDRAGAGESINEEEINKAQDVLYEALDANQGASHLIEPLILKLQDYEHTTKTETRTVTEREPIEGSYAAKSKREEIKPALEKSEGSKATVTLPDGDVRKGVLKIKSGQYVLDIPNSREVVIGEKAITDRDLKLPSEEREPEPIKMDEDGNVESVTFETKNGNLITIHDPEKALDIAIQLRADAVGEVPDAAFEKAFRDIEKETQVEVPAKNNSSSKTNNNGESNKKEGNKKADVQKGKEDGSTNAEIVTPEGSAEVPKEAEPLLSRAKELVSEVKGKAAPLLKEAAKKPENLYKELEKIAEKSDDPKSREGILKEVGPELVDISNELFPQQNTEKYKEIKKLEKEREEKIKSETKPEVKLEFVKTEDLVNSKDPIENKEEHDSIKERFKKLRELIDCLHA